MCPWSIFFFFLYYLYSLKYLILYINIFSSFFSFFLMGFLSYKITWAFGFFQIKNFFWCIFIISNWKFCYNPCGFWFINWSLFLNIIQISVHFLLFNWFQVQIQHMSILQNCNLKPNMWFSLLKLCFKQEKQWAC